MTKHITFEHGESEASAAYVNEHFAECGCEAYKDVFTYKLWKEQGKQVQKGQTGLKLTVYKKFEFERNDGTKGFKVYPKTSTVFCRHQVK